MKREQDHRSGHSAAAAGDNRTVRIEPRFSDRRAQFGDRTIGHVIAEQVAEEQVARTGNMAAGQIMDRVDRRTGEAIFIARIDDLFRARCHGRGDVGLAADDRARETGPDGMLSGSPLDGVSTTVIPTLGDSFLDRLLAIADETQDVQFRQDLTNRIIEAGQEIITVERERGYYARVGELMQSRPGSRGREMSTEVDARFETLYAAVAQRIEESDAIHAGLAAQNLSPRTGLFRITSPFSIVARRLVTARTLAPTGLFVLLVSIMMVPLVCLGYHYFRREVLVARLEGLQ